MAQDPIRAYLEARNELKALEDRLNRIVSILRHTVAVLTSRPGPGQLGPTVIAKDGRMIPDRGGLIPRDVIDLREWPSPEEIADVVAEVYRTAERIRSLWRLIPAEYQKGLQPPE